MSFKKKLSTFMSLLSTLDIMSVNAMNYNRGKNLFVNATEDSRASDTVGISEDSRDLSRSSKLLSPGDSYLFMAVCLASLAKKIYDNSITVPYEPKSKPLPSPQKPPNLINEVKKEKITWPETITMGELKTRAEKLWQNQGYTNITKSKSVLVTAESKSGKRERLCYYKPEGLFGPVYAINGAKHPEMNPSYEMISDNIELVDVSGYCDKILIQLISQIKNVWNTSNKLDVAENLSLGDIVYIYTKLVPELENKNVKNPSLTATWLLLGNNQKNSEGLKNITDLPFIKFMINNLPVISLVFPFDLEFSPSMNGLLKGMLQNFLSEMNARLPVLNVKNGKKKLTLAICGYASTVKDKIYEVTEDDNNNWMFPTLNREVGLYGDQVGPKDFSLSNCLINQHILKVRCIWGHSDLFGIAKYFLDTLATFYSLVEPLLNIGISLGNKFDEYIATVEKINNNKLLQNQKWQSDISGYLNTLKSHSNLVKSLCDLLKKTKSNEELDNLLGEYVNIAPKTFEDTKKQEDYVKKAQDRYKLLKSDFDKMSDHLKLLKYLKTRIPSDNNGGWEEGCRKKLDFTINYLSKVNTEMTNEEKEYWWFYLQVPANGSYIPFLQDPPWQNTFRGTLAKMTGTHKEKVAAIRQAFDSNGHGYFGFPVNGVDVESIVLEVKNLLNAKIHSWEDKKVEDIEFTDISSEMDLNKYDQMF